MRQEWIRCPVCGSKTRIRVCDDTVLINFPLFCPKCRQETVINVKEMNLSVREEPGAKTQSR